LREEQALKEKRKVEGVSDVIVEEKLGKTTGIEIEKEEEVKVSNDNNNNNNNVVNSSIVNESVYSTENEKVI
jgi:hypothetical protein